MTNKEKFLTMIEKNLLSNGFPSKKVSFDVEKIYEIADKYELNFNKLTEDLKEKNISYEITIEKIIFSPVNDNTSDLDSNMFEKVQEMLSKMSPEEIENIQKMYQNMSEDEKANIMNKAKNMGLF